ncbi:hypothetical protein BGW39_010896 [Mortierella sp. 14UC]|nr:hypothetical protein BGW39_010896 [Mortierella sp. 14UC]
MNSSMSFVLWKLVLQNLQNDTDGSDGGGIGIVGSQLASTREGGTGKLFLEVVKMDNVEGLDILNLRLLKQRGASGMGAIRVKVKQVDQNRYQVDE